MHLYEEDDAFGTPSEHSGTEEISSLTPREVHSDTEGRVRMLARVPDISHQGNDPGEDAPRPSGGRLISKKLSTRLLVGGGVLLLLIAVVPALLRKPQQQGGTPPAPDADLAPAFHGHTPKVHQPAVVEHVVRPMVQTAPPELNFQDNIPMPPDFLSGGPPHETAGSPTQPAANAPVSGPAMTEATGAPGIYDQRYQMQQPAPRYSREYQPAPQSAPMETPAGVPLGTAPPHTNEPPPRVPPQVIMNRGMRLDRQITQPVMASEQYHRLPATHAVDARYPGVARLQGVIEKPSVRTTSNDPPWQ